MTQPDALSLVLIREMVDTLLAELSVRGKMSRIGERPEGLRVCAEIRGLLWQCRRAVEEAWEWADRPRQRTATAQSLSRAWRSVLRDAGLTPAAFVGPREPGSPVLSEWSPVLTDGGGI